MSRVARAASAVLVGGLTVGLGAADVSAADRATCSDVLDVIVHGQHVVADYVMGADHDLVGWPPTRGVGADVGGTGAAAPGGPRHEGLGVGPGASFCLAQAQSG